MKNMMRMVLTTAVMACMVGSATGAGAASNLVASLDSLPSTLLFVNGGSGQVTTHARAPRRSATVDIRGGRSTDNSMDEGTGYDTGAGSSTGDSSPGSTTGGASSGTGAGGATDSGTGGATDTGTGGATGTGTGGTTGPGTGGTTDTDISSST